MYRLQFKCRKCGELIDYPTKELEELITDIIIQHNSKGELFVNIKGLPMEHGPVHADKLFTIHKPCNRLAYLVGYYYI